MKAVKKPITLGFRFCETPSEVVQTLEGPVTALAGDAVITGPRGEQYPAQRQKFEASYDFDLSAGTCRKKPIMVDAEEMQAPFEVQVGWSRNPLRGAAGDFRLTYGPGDFGVVRRDIFFETYTVVEP